MVLLLQCITEDDVVTEYSTCGVVTLVFSEGDVVTEYSTCGVVTSVYYRGRCCN